MTESTQDCIILRDLMYERILEIKEYIQYCKIRRKDYMICNNLIDRDITVRFRYNILYKIPDKLTAFLRLKGTVINIFNENTKHRYIYF